MSVTTSTASQQFSDFDMQWFCTHPDCDAFEGADYLEQLKLIIV